MHKWFASFRLEVRMIFTNWFFLLLPVLFGLWFANDLAQIAPPRSQDIVHFAYDFHKVKQTLSLGVAMLLGIVMIRRDLRKTTYDWLGSLPVSSAVSLICKYVAGLIYLSLFTIAMMVTYSWFASQRGVTGREIWEYLSFFGLQYEWSYAVTLALAMSLAVFIKNRIAYLIGFCAWMFGTFFIDIFIISRNNLYFLKTFHLNQILLHSFIEHEVWGFRVIAREIWYSRFFVLAFILLLLVMMIAFLKHARPSRTYRRWMGISLATLLLAGTAFTPYGLMWKERYLAFADKAKDAILVDDQKVVQTFTIESYDIHLKQVSDNQVEGSATMQIPTEELANQNKASFTLNRIFTVNQVVVNDQEGQFQQKGDIVEVDLVHIDPKVARQKVTVHYGGKVIDWHYLYQMDMFNAYADEHYLLLPEEMAWYPLAGMRALYIEGHGTSRHNLWLNTIDDVNPSYFTVTIEGISSEVYSTIEKIKASKQNADGEQQFQENGVKGVSIYAGGLVEVTIPNEPLKVITAPSNRAEAVNYLTALSEMKNYYADMVERPLHDIERIFYFSPIGNRLDIDQQLEGKNYFITERQTHNLDEYQIVRVISNCLFGDMNTDVFFSDNLESSKDFSIVSELRLAFYYLYGRDHLSLTHEQTIESMSLFPDSKDKKFPSPIFKYDENPILKQIIDDIDQAISAGKMEQVKEGLNTFRAQGLTIDFHNYEAEYPRYSMEDWQKVWDQVMNP